MYQSYNDVETVEMVLKPRILPVDAQVNMQNLSAEGFE